MYLRLLLDGTAKSLEIHQPGRFFNELYHRLLREPRRQIRLLCLQGLAVTYQSYHDAIGPFPDITHVLSLLASTTHRAERDRYLLLVRALLASTPNAKRLIACGGLQVLLSLLTTVHLESDRSAHSQVLQTNLLTTSAAPDEPRREWYVRRCAVDAMRVDDETDGGGAAAAAAEAPAAAADGDGGGGGGGAAGRPGETHGPFDAAALRSWLEARVAAGASVGEGYEVHGKDQGEIEARSSWVACRASPHVAWACLAHGTPLLSYTQLGVLVLDVMLGLMEMHPTRTPQGALIHPMPSPKKVLSRPERLPHLVQLLLTMEPSIVERAASLLTKLVADNPSLPRLYLTGGFFFALMYTGSNVLPIIRFLHVAHLQQVYRDDESADGGIAARSYLTLVLPHAMVCCLEKLGADKFAEVFLGEFDTPEYIWNHEMRRLMIEKLALHVGELPLKLQANCTALYDYCPLPRIVYPELKDELFCHRHYLRHLCDEERFGEWPIEEPVPLLQSILAAWQQELRKTPSSMSRTEALAVLGMSAADLAAAPPSSPGGGGGAAASSADAAADADPTLRRAYHKLAAKYHPDKNPEPAAREMFEKVQKAYELLVSEPRHLGGPDPHNVSLMLRAQGILYRRCREALAPFKYSGYPLLLKVLATVDEATGADVGTLFSEANSRLLLPAATLLHATLDAAPLNAHELQRVGGVESMVALFRRCVSMLTVTSEPFALPYKVALPLVKSFGVAAASVDCCAKLSSPELAPALDDLVRCLRLTQLPHLSEAAAASVSALCAHAGCQHRLAAAGAAWFGYARLSDYDFTLDGAVAEGVEASAESNAQQVANERGRLAARMLRKLGGYRGAGTPKHGGVRAATRNLLTQFFDELLDNEDEATSLPTLLRLVNSASETPYLIWNHTARAELVDFVQARLERAYARLRNPQPFPTLALTHTRTRRCPALPHHQERARGLYEVPQ